MSDYEWVFFPAAVLAVLLFRIALAPFWMQREVKQNLVEGSQAQVIAAILEHGSGTYTVDESVWYDSEEDVLFGVQRIQGGQSEILTEEERAALTAAPTDSDAGEPVDWEEVAVGLAAELDELKAVAPPPERTAGLELATLSIMFARHGFNPVVGGEYEALIREISALTQPASQPVFATTCTGHQHEGCNYLGLCGSVCNKCGNLLECVTWMTRPARQRGGGE